MKHEGTSESGFTLVELTVVVTAFAIIAVSFLGLFTSLVRSTILSKRQAVASTLATNQMEYLKSLPYDSLAIAGGAIYSASPLPATTTKTFNNVHYTITTSINYVDDAYDGCGSYPTQALKQLYCRNYPPPAGSPATDLNPQDYKIIHVSVTDNTGTRLAQVDTQVSSRVAETASTTGAMFVTVIDDTGAKVSGATVSVTNSTVAPAVNLSDSSDSNGTAIFYGLPPDNGTDYVITASKTGYSTLSTIAPSGSLTPTYPSQKILTQQSSYVTLTIKKQGTNSLIVETVDTDGNQLANVKLYIKGGYKKYTSTSNTAYYYDNMSPSDNRPTTDGTGLLTLSSLVPGAYIFCGDAGATSCARGATTYYLAAAVPYGGSNSFNPILVPTYDPLDPPATTFDYSGTAYLQKVRLIMTTSSTFPRVNTVTPSDVSKTGGSISSFSFTVTGTNLPCSASPGSCSTTVQFIQGASTFTASCTGASGTQLNCTVDLSTTNTGVLQMKVVVGSETLLMPADPLLGGINVTP